MEALLVLLVLGAIALAGVIMFFGLSTTDKVGYREFHFRFSPIVVGLSIVTVAISIATSVGVINAGHRGVVLRFGALTGKVLGEGLYFITPGVESVVEMTTQVQAYKTSASAASRDLQEVRAEVTLNYSLDGNKAGLLYQTVGLDFENRIIVPAVQESVKAATALFDAERLIVERPKVKDAIETSLRARMEAADLKLIAFSLTDFKFSTEFAKAIEEKQVAQQKALKAKNDLERVKMEAEQSLAKLRAEAEGLRLQKDQISVQLISLRQLDVQKLALDVQMEAVKKWNGAFPTTIVGTSPGNLPILSIFGLGDKK